jgi:hypothetical protein
MEKSNPKPVEANKDVKPSPEKEKHQRFIFKKRKPARFSFAKNRQER